MELEFVNGFFSGIGCFGALLVVIFFVNKYLKNKKNEFEKINKRLDDVEYETKSISYELGMKSLPPADLSVNYIGYRE